MPGLQTIILSVISLAAGAASASLLLAVFAAEPVTVYLTPSQATHSLNETFTVAVKVKADEPVNVFKGRLEFDPNHLQIEKIDYNTSLADLWAEEPWYSNGAGTVSFIGGTTKPGGFRGDEVLLTITLRGTQVGQSTLHLTELRVLRHDGLGTDAGLATPIDALFIVPEVVLERETVAKPKEMERNIATLATEKSTDLNGDGRHSIADLSIFMRHLATQNPRSDFNGDGLVSGADLSIILIK